MGQAQTVSYERLVSFGQFQNERIGVTLAVAEDEEPATTLAKAQAFVESELAARQAAREEVEDATQTADDKIREINRTVWTRQDELKRVEKAVATGKTRLRALNKVLKANGLATIKLNKDFIPF